MQDIIFIVGLIIALTIHEFSHSLAADRLGDPTPRSQGRLTLNPLAHLDPLGTLMLIIAHFGWGKPVPIDPYNFRSPRRDELLVSLAGPSSNLILALLFTLAIRLFSPPFLAATVLFLFIQVNVYLAIFNLLPIPPLDGSKIFLNLLPPDIAATWEEALTRYGPILLIILIFFPFLGGNLLSSILLPIVNTLLGLLAR
ncbi:MAG: site-2 protease family protein, partial [Candidatus Shapirobacteria bacterium]